MSTPDPRTFAEWWVASWNNRDVATILAQFADDAVFTSPTARRFAEDGSGVLRGKDALRQYWHVALEANPDLHFELCGVYAGVDTIVVNYRNQLRHMIAEILMFSGGKIVTGHATHFTSP